MKYGFDEYIGKGQYGCVYRAIRQDGSFVAIKRLKNVDSDICTEIDVIKKLDHPNVVKYIDNFKVYRWTYIVMEYIPGKTLEACVAQKRFASERALALFLDVCKGIKYLHANNVIHRDLKCLNIIVQPDGVVKICDFGVSKFLDPFDRTTTRLGTPYYLAPEVIMGNGGYNHSADMWSAGIVLYHMLTREYPVNGCSIVEYIASFRRIKYPIVVKGATDQVNTILRGLLTDNVEQRYTASEVICIIEERKSWISLTELPRGGMLPPIGVQSSRMSTPTSDLRRVSVGELPPTPAHTKSLDDLSRGEKMVTYIRKMREKI
jgi:serine/threonine protein kinase